MSQGLGQPMLRSLLVVITLHLHVSVPMDINVEYKKRQAEVLRLPSLHMQGDSFPVKTSMGDKLGSD
ncbi:hypothetical protein PI125_g20169 [Phytophthora idaei]|nr:hypothetical protein PI125_g20169 [Phytophthora idaei]KAG3133635.1 hypothetical protein PI126_g19082 [Phytophthora idaei]